MDEHQCHNSRTQPFRRRILPARAVAFVLVAVAVIWALRRNAPVSFGGTTAITFAQVVEGGQVRTIRVTAAKEVERIIATIHLIPKEDCACSHEHEVVFEKPNEQITASFCGHCFSVRGAEKGGYNVPAAFYSEFRKLALSRTNEDWHLQP